MGGVESAPGDIESTPMDVELGKNGSEVKGALAEASEAMGGDNKGVAMTAEQQLRYYVAQNDEDKVRELKQAGADVNARDMGPVAADDEDTSGKKKKKKKKDAYEPDIDPDTGVDRKKVYFPITEDTPLHIAAERGHVNMVKLLFFLGAKVDKANRVGSTALHRAVSMGHVPVVEELLRVGADIHARNKIGSTPLHVAAAAGNLQLIKLLLEHGADKDLATRNKVHLTPVEYTLRKTEERKFFLEQFPATKEFVTDDNADEENLNVLMPTGAAVAKDEDEHKHDDEEEDDEEV